MFLVNPHDPNNPVEVAHARLKSRAWAVAQANRRLSAAEIEASIELWALLVGPQVTAEAADIMRGWARRRATKYSELQQNGGAA